MAFSSLSLSSILVVHISLALILPYASAVGGFRVELIHRDSPKSPFYDPKATRFQWVKAAAQRSAVRANHIGLTVSQFASSNGPIQSKVMPDGGSYLMSFKLGTPPMDMVAIADTGSDLIWTNCKPCTSCYAQATPMFDPAASSTYRDVSCDSEPCQALPEQGCGYASGCDYHYAYGDHSNVDGVLAVETFAFDTTGGDTVSVPKVVFGCSHQSNGTFSKNTAGLVGLGGGPLSLISQLGTAIDRKFAYCFVPLNAAQDSSWLNFGDGVVLPGRDVLTTPLFQNPDHNTFYYLSLQDITVAGQKIAVAQSSSSSESSGNGGNIIIDSGTTLTMLFPDVLQNLVSILSDVISLPLVTEPQYNFFGACYQSDAGVSGDNFPGLTFKFEGAAVELSPSNVFVEVDQGVVCLAMTESENIQIYGNIAQQNFYVDYDLGNSMLSFVPTDCSSA